MPSDDLKPCRGCKSLIRFVLTPKRRRMPIDPRPAREGNVRLERVFDEVVAVTLAGGELDRAREASEPLYTSHFATCPKAAQFKRRKQPRRVSHARGRVL
jgi:hypothetical protein